MVFLVYGLFYLISLEINLFYFSCLNFFLFNQVLLDGKSLSTFQFLCTNFLKFLFNYVLLDSLKLIRSSINKN